MLFVLWANLSDVHPPYTSQSWANILWFWTSRWRLPAHIQRQILAWWQCLGWQDGWKYLLETSTVKQTVLSDLQLSPAIAARLSDSASWQALAKAVSEMSGEEQPQTRWYWVSYVEPNFPVPLRSLDSAPTVLWSDRPWVSTEKKVWDNPRLAVVGSRQCTQYGLLAVKSLIPEFARKHNATIVSGGAQGIDFAAHQAAVQVSQTTWVVLGCGLNHAPKHLLQFSAEPNRLLSPFPPEQAPQKWTFPARNHLIAQLSQAVLIVEGAANSGSLITAGAAVEYGREVLVVLPPFSSPNAAGALRLLKQGATPVASVSDIAVAMELVETYPEKTITSQNFTPDQQDLLQTLQKNGGSFPLVQLLAALKTSTQAGSLPANTITALELQGAIKVELGVVRLQSVLQS